MGKYDILGEAYPPQDRYFGGEIYELYDHPKVSEGSNKNTARKVANELRRNGNRARVVKAKGKWWVYWG